MAIAYQHDAMGYFVREEEDYGFPPNNSTAVKPELKAGYIPKWTGSYWVQEETHKGEEGWLNGQPYTIDKHGPYPAGFTLEKPAPTEEELKAERILRLKGQLSAIDQASVRPLRAISDGTATSEDHSILQALEREAQKLREELATLEPAGEPLAYRLRS